MEMCGSGGSKSRLAKAAGAEPADEMRDEKLHAVVARSTFPSQNVQSTPWSDHFWKLRRRKSARRCGAKDISKSKCTKHTMVGPLLEVAMSKKCTPLWREAHFEVKMCKTHHCRTTFGSCDVEKVHAVLVRSTFPSQNVQNTTCSRHFRKLRCRKSVRRSGAKRTFRSQNVQSTPWSDHFWKLRCRKSARRCGAKHISKSKCTKHTMVGPLLEVATSKKCTPLWREAHCQVKMYKTHRGRTTFGSCDVEHYTTLHSTTLQLHLHNYTPLHSTTHHYTTSHYTTLQLPNYIPLHSTALNSITLQIITLHYTPLRSTTLHYTTLLHYTTFHYTSLHYTTLHSTTLQLQLQLHSTTLHYTTLDWMTLHHR